MTNSNDSASQSSVPATLINLSWMCGAWTGTLGPQSVEEAWSQPHGGTMSTMVRLLTADATLMIELISIREQDGTLILHLRQFSPDLQLVTSQDMPLDSINTDLGNPHVAFRGPADGSIPRLAYHATSQQHMEVHVTTADQTVVVATLDRR